MVDEPDNLVLVMLREMRSTLGDMNKRIEEMTGRIDEMRRDHGELRTWVQLAIGMGMTNQLKSSELEARLAALEKSRPQP